MSCLLNKILALFGKSKQQLPEPTEPEQMKFLVVGLGNIGAEYQGTRHNIGFTVVNALVEQAGATFATQRYGDVAQMRVKNQQLLVLKPSTYMKLGAEREDCTRSYPCCGR